MMRPAVTTLLLAFSFSPLLAKPDGEKIYRELCASCHGQDGEGVVGEYDEALVGTRSIESLTRLIHRTMPPEEEEKCVDEEALAVSEYIYEAFYSPEAQARLKPVRVELVRLTQYQYRHAVSDLVNAFRWNPKVDEKRGLRTRIFNAEQMNHRKDGLSDDVRQHISFDYEQHKPHEGINQQAFSILWTGFILPEESGSYSFRVSSPNGFRLDVNHETLLDGWVSSNNEVREMEGRVALLAGHPVRFQIDYLSYEEAKSSLRVEWKTPNGTWEPIPSRLLHPEEAPRIYIPNTPFPADDSSLGYERGSTVSKAWKDAVTNAAIEGTNWIYNEINSLAKTKLGEEDRGEKIKQFSYAFVERAFSRPLNDTLREQYVDRHFRDQDADTAVKKVLLLTLISPRFLYPALNVNENGEADQFTTASYLSYSLLDSIPPNYLWDAAKNGHLSNQDQIRQQAGRLLGDARARYKVNRFFYHWLGLAERNNLNKSSEVFPGFDESVHSDLKASLDFFINEIVWSEKSDYRQLFLSNTWYVSSRLNRLYGTQQEEHFEGFRPVQDDKRAGLITHPYLMAAFAYHNSTSPIHRGVFFSRNVLGRYLKPPTEANTFEDSHFSPDLTMREKVVEMTKNDSCMTCHEIINPIGFSLEEYDAIGRFRTTDNNKPVNTSSPYPTETADIVEINSPKDVARMAVENPTAHKAFITSLFHHLVQQSTRAYGNETLSELQKKFSANEFHIQRLIADIAVSAAPMAKPESPKPQEPKPEDKPKEEPAPAPAPPAEPAKPEEAPKQEAPKQEAPKQEAPKQEAPKQEAQPAPVQPASAEEQKPAQPAPAQNEESQPQG